MTLRAPCDALPPECLSGIFETLFTPEYFSPSLALVSKTWKATFDGLLRSRGYQIRFALMQRASLLSERVIRGIDPNDPALLRRINGCLRDVYADRCGSGRNFNENVFGPRGGSVLIHPGQLESLLHAAEVDASTSFALFWDTIRADLWFDPPESITERELRSWLANPANRWELEEVRAFRNYNPEMKILPQEIGYLTNLTECDIKGTHVRSLPPVLGALQQLQKLTVSYTSIVTLPSTLAQHQSLTQLNMSGVHISASSEVLQALSQRPNVTLSGRDSPWSPIRSPSPRNPVYRLRNEPATPPPATFTPIREGLSPPPSPPSPDAAQMEPNAGAEAPRRRARRRLSFS